MTTTIFKAAAVITMGVVFAACNLLETAIGPRKAIAELPFAGDRADAPPLEERGNAAFQFASFDESGAYLVTVPFMGPGGLAAWDGRTGALLSRIPTGLPMVASTPVWMIDGTRGRLLGFKHPGPTYQLFDLKTGALISEVTPEVTDEKHPPQAAGLAGDGNQALFFVPGFLELWQLDPPALVKRVESPMPADHYIPGCVGGIPATYNDKGCWEWSPDRRTLAVAFTPVFSPKSESHFVLIDAATLEATELTMPTEDPRRGLASFAFSPDNRWLAVGTDHQLLMYDRVARAWGATVEGDHKRNRLIGPMGFTADSRRVVALEDQLQISVYDAETGARLGRHEPDFNDMEGELKVSRDGSRMLVYTFVSDIYEVLDGADAHHVGWVCPYFCNAMHNPIQPGYAVSPDGRSVAVSHRRGTAVWDTTTNQIRYPLSDPERKPLPWPYEQR